MWCECHKVPEIKLPNQMKMEDKYRMRSVLLNTHNLEWKINEAQIKSS